MARFEIQDLRARHVSVENLRLDRRDCAVVHGPSGAGKSLLLRAIADLDPVDGNLLLDGVHWRDMPAPQWRRRVGLVPAEPGWWHERVDQHFVDCASMEPTAVRIGLEPRCLRAPVMTLSTGERLRLALLRALEASPQVLLLDEPTSALDTESRDAVAALLEERLADGTIMLIVSHDPEFRARMATRMLRLESGELVVGPPA